MDEKKLEVMKMVVNGEKLEAELDEQTTDEEKLLYK